MYNKKKNILIILSVWTAEKLDYPAMYTELNTPTTDMLCDMLCRA